MKEIHHIYGVLSLNILLVSDDLEEIDSIESSLAVDPQMTDDTRLKIQRADSPVAMTTWVGRIGAVPSYIPKMLAVPLEVKRAHLRQCGVGPHRKNKQLDPSTP